MNGGSASRLRICCSSSLSMRSGSRSFVYYYHIVYLRRFALCVGFYGGAISANYLYGLSVASVCSILAHIWRGLSTASHKGIFIAQEYLGWTILPLASLGNTHLSLCRHPAHQRIYQPFAQQHAPSIPSGYYVFEVNDAVELATGRWS